MCNVLAHTYSIICDRSYSSCLLVGFHIRLTQRRPVQLNQLKVKFRTKGSPDPIRPNSDLLAQHPNGRPWRGTLEHDIELHQCDCIMKEAIRPIVHSDIYSPNKRGHLNGCFGSEVACDEPQPTRRRSKFVLLTVRLWIIMLPLWVDIYFLFGSIHLDFFECIIFESWLGSAEGASVHCGAQVLARPHSPIRIVQLAFSYLRLEVVSEPRIRMFFAGNVSFLALNNNRNVTFLVCVDLCQSNAWTKSCVFFATFAIQIWMARDGSPEIIKSSAAKLFLFEFNDVNCVPMWRWIVHKRAQMPINAKRLRNEENENEQWRNLPQWQFDKDWKATN